MSPRSPLSSLVLLLFLVDVVNALGLVDFTRVIFQFPHTETATDPVTAYTVLGVGLSIAAVGFYLGIIPREFRIKRSVHGGSSLLQMSSLLDLISELDEKEGGCLTSYLCHLEQTPDGYLSTSEQFIKETLKVVLSSSPLSDSERTFASLHRGDVCPSCTQFESLHNSLLTTRVLTNEK